MADCGLIMLTKEKKEAKHKNGLKCEFAFPKKDPWQPVGTIKTETKQGKRDNNKQTVLNRLMH